MNERTEWLRFYERIERQSTKNVRVICFNFSTGICQILSSHLPVPINLPMTVEKFRGGEGREARLRKRNWGYLYYEIPKVEKELAFRSVFCAAKCLDRQSRSEKESLRPFSHRGSKATADRKGQTPEIASRQKEPQYSHQRGTRQPLVPTWWQRG